MGRAAACDRGQGGAGSGLGSCASCSTRARSRRGRPGYLLRVEPGALDLERFQSLLDQGRERLAQGDAREAGELLREALGLWRGSPLAEFEYEAFARNEIGRLEELRLAALELRLEADLALGRHSEVVGELEGLVRDHPLRESFSRLLILALYRAGRQADALAAYQDARARLVDELGLDPSQALQQLEKQILLHDSALDLPAAKAAGPAPAPAAAAYPSTPAVMPVAREQRKTVTVLFCDVVGSTALGEQTDPEALRALLARYFERMKAIVESHGGTVEKFIGDAVMAVFGVPAVHEDDALRACRAAVEMRDALPELGIEGPDRCEHRRGRDRHGGAAGDRGRGERGGAVRAGGRAGRGADRRGDACARARGGGGGAGGAADAEGEVAAGAGLPAPLGAGRAGAQPRLAVRRARAGARADPRGVGARAGAGALRAADGGGRRGRGQVAAGGGGARRGRGSRGAGPLPVVRRGDHVLAGRGGGEAARGAPVGSGRGGRDPVAAGRVGRRDER